VTAKLYVIPGSHPCDCAEAALRLKGLDYRRVDLLPVIHKGVIRARFTGSTAPALELASGQRLVGSGAIMRRLDELVPEPRLTPTDPELRAKVEASERWGNEVLQPLVRRVAWATLKRDKQAMLSYGAHARLGVSKPFVSLGSKPVAAIASHFNRATDDVVSADMRVLPGYLDKVDAWVGEGVLGGESPNLADLQIGSSLRLLLSFGDTRPLVAGRPCDQLAERGFEPLSGSAPAGILPASWLR
jgi:glutathione S-transferase